MRRKANCKTIVMKIISNTLKPLFVLGLLNAITIPSTYATAGPVTSQVTSPFAITLLGIMLALLLVIGLLAYVLLGVAEIRLHKVQEAAKKAASISAIWIVMLCMATLPVSAQVKVAEVVAPTITNYDGLSAFSYNTMVFIIGLEVLLIIVMSLFIQTLLAKDKIVVASATIAYKEPIWKVWWEKINSFKPEGAVADTGHDYDGIRELDNRLPPWWLYGFYACVVFALVYLYRFEVVHTAPSTIQEYEIAMADAVKEKEEYLKHAASKVDENSVVLLTDASALSEGKKLFGASCSPCHGAEAQGVVGPNLTDDYWLYEGGVKDVFKIIKYGVPEKGMKSWKDDFSPVQIAQISSYIKSLHGSKPTNAKEPQGEVYKELTEHTTVENKSEKSLVTNE